MTDTSPAKPDSANSKFWFGMAVGGGLGLLVGCVGGLSQTGSVTTTGAPKSEVSGLPAAPPEALKPAPPPTPDLAITVGRPSSEYGYVTYPVTLQNTTQQDFTYAEVRCTFFDDGGQLLASEMENWMGLGAGETVSGEVSTNKAKPSEISRYECRARSN